jgi:hypothetical protein
MDFVRLHGVETVDEHANMELQHSEFWAYLVQSNSMFCFRIELKLASRMTALVNIV